MSLPSSPQKKYQKLLVEGSISPDSAQAAAIATLDGIYHRLTAKWQRSGWKRFFMRAPQPVKGVYFWGGVGRGKTFLVDLFFDCCDTARKQRVHFHRFMQSVHQQLTQMNRQQDPLKRIAKDLAQKIDLLCFDEFFVSDIADAMLLGGLFNALIENGVVIVATSNVVPDELYKNGLHRKRFLPTIELINQHLEVQHFVGDEDYRLRALEKAEIYHWPLDETADDLLAHTFDSICPNEPIVGQNIDINGRKLATKRCGDGVVWFIFDTLCRGPRSPNDYIEIARCFHTVLVSQVPILKTGQDDVARRFIHLVDEFYDRQVKLILSAEACLEQLYQGSKLAFEFKRTFSRLQEMQTHHYLALPHIP